MPWIAFASVLATMTRSDRACAAALIFSANCSAGTTDLPSRWPQRFGFTWSSIWMAPAPASSSSLTVRTTFSASPKPVSASTSTGSPLARTMRLVRSTSSSRVIRPTSGRPRLAEKAAPDR